METLPALKGKDYGLETAKAKKILTSFKPAEIEIAGLLKVYELLITKEITPEIELEAAALDKKLMAVESDLNGTHKTEKAFYLAAGRFVDAKKNREIKPVLQMRAKMKELKNFTKNKEAADALILEEKRRTALIKAGSEPAFLPAKLNEMDQEVFDVYLSGIKTQFDAAEKVKAEAAAQKIIDDKAQQKINDQVKKDLAKEKNKSDELAKQLKEKTDAEAAEKSRKEAEAEAELKKGDAAKMKDLIADLEAIPTKFEFKSARNKKLYDRVNELLLDMVQGLKK